MPRVVEIVKGIFGKPPSWFNRYTDNARRTIFFGRWEALQMGADLIEPEHIALGLFRDEWLVEQFLEKIDTAELRITIIANLPPPGEPRQEGDLPLSPRSKRVLANAAADADTLLDSHIGNEHLLLGLLREERFSRRGTVSNALSGVSLDELRLRIIALARETRLLEGGMQAARWREAGIPHGYSISKLLYNPAAEILILELKAHAGDFHPKRLMIRQRAVDRYEPVGAPAEDISYDSPVTCEKLPIVVFNSWKLLSKSEDGVHHAADWEATHILDLKTRDISVCVSKENFIVPPLYDVRGWINEILSISDDGAYAYVRVGLGQRRTEGEKVEVYYNYHLAKLDLSTRRLELLSQLKNIHF